MTQWIFSPRLPEETNIYFVTVESYDKNKSQIERYVIPSAYQRESVFDSYGQLIAKGWQCENIGVGRVIAYTDYIAPKAAFTNIGEYGMTIEESVSTFRRMAEIFKGVKKL